MCFYENNMTCEIVKCNYCVCLFVGQSRPHRMSCKNMLFHSFVFPSICLVCPFIHTYTLRAWQSMTWDFQWHTSVRQWSGECSTCSWAPQAYWWACPVQGQTWCSGPWGYDPVSWSSSRSGDVSSAHSGNAARNHLRRVTFPFLLYSMPLSVL